MQLFCYFADSSVFCCLLWILQYIVICVITVYSGDTRKHVCVCGVCVVCVCVWCCGVVCVCVCVCVCGVCVCVCVVTVNPVMLHYDQLHINHI